MNSCPIISQYFAPFARLRTWTCDALNAAIGFMSSKSSLNKQLASAKLEAESCRAQLIQLRCYQTGVHGRTGWMVSAFIPNEVAERLNTQAPPAREQFRRTIADVLVNSALERLYHVSHQGTVTALIFEPLTHAKQEVGLAATMFETPQGAMRIHDTTPKEKKYDKSALRQIGPPR